MIRNLNNNGPYYYINYDTWKNKLLKGGCIFRDKEPGCCRYKYKKNSKLENSYICNAFEKFLNDRLDIEFYQNKK